MKTILLTGGTGYIGSHTAVELIENGYQTIIVDNLSNSSADVIERIESITGVKPIFYEMDVASPELEQIFQKHQIDAVIHFAGFKAVGESVAKPLMYYNNNLNASINLIKIMQKYNVRQLIFSSTATVYGTCPAPYSETDQTGIGITNPYSHTKHMIEQIMRDVCVADPEFHVVSLRYFNPIGAHSSGLIGENPKDIPNNLLPFVLKVANGELPEVRVFGNDYDTPDGTGIRDYIHVVDLAKGHLAALNETANGFVAYNLGTGKGSSVFDIIHAVETACGHSIPYKITERRPGDIAVIVANPQKAEQVFGWRADLTIDQSCKDSWNWTVKSSQK